MNEQCINARLRDRYLRVAVFSHLGAGLKDSLECLALVA